MVLLARRYGSSQRPSNGWLYGIAVVLVAVGWFSYTRQTLIDTRNKPQKSDVQQPGSASCSCCAPRFLAANTSRVAAPAAASTSQHKIPKILHRVFLAGREKFDVLRGNANSSIKAEWADWCQVLHRNAGWEYRFWDNVTVTQLLEEHYSFFVPTWNKYNKRIYRSDAIRYLIMHHVGGLYLDLDVECFREAYDMLEGFDVVIQGSLGWEGTTNSVMASAPGHPFWMHLIKLLEERADFDTPIQKETWGDNPIYATGPMAVRDALNSSGVVQLAPDQKDVAFEGEHAVNGTKVKVWPIGRWYMPCWFTDGGCNNRMAENAAAGIRDVRVAGYHRFSGTWNKNSDSQDPAAWNSGKDNAAALVEEVKRRPRVAAAEVCLPPLDKAWPSTLKKAEMQVFSRHQQDGVLLRILHNIGFASGTYVELGVEDRGRHNSRMLRELLGWTGLLLDHRHGEPGINLQKVDAITPDNINQLLSNYFTGSVAALDPLTVIDVLSCDLDFLDWYVWRALDNTRFQPRVVLIEVNSLPANVSATVDISDKHGRWMGTNYMGASLKALAELGQRKGYTLVYEDSVGATAFFVRSDILRCQGVEAPAMEALWQPARYRDGRGHPPETDAERQWLFLDASGEVVKREFVGNWDNPPLPSQ